jgi:DNA polymerase-3 subunit alpha
MTALLTAESRGTSGPVKNEKIAQGVAECKRLKIPVLPPDINKSESEFSIENKNSIRFGLSAIKNVGDAAIGTVLLARTNGPFKNLEDFCTRVDLSSVNKKTIESLIKAGAMDSFGKRSNLLMTYPEIAQKVHKNKKEKSEGQASLFGESKNEKIESTAGKDISDFSDEEKLAFEKEFLGFYLTSHPQMENLQKVKLYISHQIDVLEEETEGTRVVIGGLIDNMRRIFTKRTGNEMAFITVSDERGLAVECVVFPRIFEQYKNLLIRDTVIIVNGKIDTKNERPVVIVDKISGVGKLTS